MPIHKERRIMPYTPAQMYALVADMERYPEFLPWCVALKVRRKDPINGIEADMTIGYKALREQFTTRVMLEPEHQIKVEYLNGPFRYLHNSWGFLPHPRGCEVVFYIDFEFR